MGTKLKPKLQIVLCRDGVTLRNNATMNAHVKITGSDTLTCVLRVAESQHEQTNQITLFTTTRKKHNSTCYSLAP